ncbi:MAG: DNA adenine methylase [Nitrospira sp.]|nr:DNA adenine methylase [Nitrospira sp.]
MKYMGSKRWMLNNGLGTILADNARNAKRFVDLFAGSGAVSSHVAKTHKIPVCSFDIQEFSCVLTGAVIHRNRPILGSLIWEPWQKRAESILNCNLGKWPTKITWQTVRECRDWSDAQNGLPVTKAYGGHYFSPQQSVWIDAFRKTLPTTEPNRTVALAALIEASGWCVAAPGHTAQPFRPTRTAKKFLEEAWCKDIVERVRSCLISLAILHAKMPGRAKVGDANEAATGLTDGDLVFIDPPYSGVQYSRFYHVLETIARGGCGEVSGVGRYPSIADRPTSKYSRVSESQEALKNLLEAVSLSGAVAVLTFPDHICSNGLSGEIIREMAEEHFKVNEKIVESKFSTLGGTGRFSKTGTKREPRQNANELILLLRPK